MLGNSFVTVCLQNPKMDIKMPRRELKNAILLSHFKPSNVLIFENYVLRQEIEAANRSIYPCQSPINNKHQTSGNRIKIHRAPNYGAPGRKSCGSKELQPAASRQLNGFKDVLKNS